MNRTLLNQIYDILVEECGANPNWRYNFVDAHLYDDCKEYRFQGLLGFGGKFRSRNGIYVDYYPEDKNDVRDEIVRKTNEKLLRITIENKKDA